MSDREAPRERSAYAVFQPMQTRWNDNDQFGHMYNATYVELFDEAMNMTLLGLDFLDHRSGGQIMVVVENGCTYFREVAYPDRLQIGLRVASQGRSSFRLEMGMFREGEKTEAARAYFVLVNVDNDSRRPQPMTEAQKNALQSVMAGAV